MTNDRMSRAEERLSKMIAANSVVIFGRAACPYTLRAKALLDDITADIASYDLDLLAEGEALHDAVVARTEQETSPAIWLNGKFVGGCGDVDALHRTGRLVKMLQ